MFRASPIVIVALIYAVCVMAASWGIYMMWGNAAQLIFMPFAFIGGLLIGRLMW